MSLEICPICGQDWLYVVRVVPLNKQLAWICPECDAFWDETTRAIPRHHESYGAYMEKRGLEGTWDNLEVVTPKPGDFSSKQANSNK